VRAVGLLSTTGIGRRHGTGPAPLSEQQRSLWFLEQAGFAGAYNIPLVSRIRGDLDVPALRRALLAVAARHDVLRTVLQRAAGSREVRQRVLPPDEFEPLLFPDDWDGTPGVPFRLGGGPLVRARIRRDGYGDHRLCLEFHHAVFDGVSQAVFWRDLWAAYRGEELAPLPTQYADYAVWQQERLTAGVLDRQADWWARQLAGAPALCTVPTDRPRVRGAEGAAGEIQIRLPSAVGHGLVPAARAEGASPYMLMLAALQVVLAGRTGTTDIVIGSPTAGRVRPELDALIGYFVNTVVVRTPVVPGGTLRDHLRRARDSVLAALDHQEVPFSRVVEAVGTSRTPGVSPLFQVLYAHQGEAARPAGPGGLVVTEMTTEPGSAKYDLNVVSWQDADGMAIVVEYDQRLYDRATVQGFADELTGVVAALVTDPGRHVAPYEARAAQPAEPSRAGAAPRPPRTPVEEFLHGSWIRLLGHDDLGVHDDFFARGGHSFLGMRLLSWIRREYGVDLPPATLFEQPTIAGLAEVVSGSLGRSGPGGPVRLGDGTGPALLLVHPVGGGITCYVDLAHRLSRPVHAIEAAGLASVEEMADAYLEAIIRAGHRPPYALGGWSMGGLLAAEISRRLFTRTGGSVPVVMIDSHATRPPGPDLTEAAVVAWFAADWGASTGHDFGPGCDTAAELWRRARAAGLLLADPDVAAAEGLLRRFTTNLRAFEAFRPAAGHPGRLHLLAAAGERWAPPDRGWGAVTGGLRIHEVPGDHYTAMTGPGLPALIDRLLGEEFGE
jgi:thioesterase domain-containing protein